MVSKTRNDIIALCPAVQNYAWGIAPANQESIVARMYAYASSDQIDAVKPYAELWIGTHPNGPAKILGREETLLEYIQREYPNQPSAVPPFLLKILSVAKPLSIQAHPDKQLAKQLHSSKPDKYKDDNHKPEMSVALTDFEGMCNFRPFQDILSSVEDLSPLATLCGGDDTLSKMRSASSSEEKRDALRTLFHNLMNASPDMVSEALSETIKIAKTSTTTEGPHALFLSLVGYYPGDVGCFCAYLLNHVKVHAGQAFFMAANEPHAYLKGQCVEIMALSDNVVRAGLTPKFKDVDVLVNMLTYNDGMPTIMNGEDVDPYCKLYKPPVEEFELKRFSIPPSKTYQLAKVQGPSIVMVVGGTGWISRKSEDVDGPETRKPLQAGSVYYITDSTAANISANPSIVSSGPSPDLFFFRATARQD